MHSFCKRCTTSISPSIKCGTRWVRLSLYVPILHSASFSALFFGFRLLLFQNSASIGMKAWHRHFLDNKPPITAACRLVALECPFEVSSFMDTWTCLGFTGHQIFLVGALPIYRLLNFCNWLLKFNKDLKHSVLVLCVCFFLFINCWGSISVY